MQNTAPLGGIRIANPTACNMVPRYSGLRVRRYGPSASMASPCIVGDCTTLAPTYAAPQIRIHAPIASSTMAAISSAFVAPLNDSNRELYSSDESTSHVDRCVQPRAAHHGAQKPSQNNTACTNHRNLYSYFVAFIKSCPPS